MQTILLIDDNPGDVRLVKEALSESPSVKFALQQASNLQSGLTMLNKEKIDALLLDLSLPDSAGIDTFYRVREKAPQMPTIILSGLPDVKGALHAVSAGAQDYLVKNQISSAVLIRSIRFAIERSKREQCEHEIQKMQDRFQALTENAPDGIALIDKDGKMKFVSPAGRRMFGYSRDEDLEINPAEHTHSDELPGVLAALSKVMEQPTANPTLQYRFKHRDGTWLWIEGTFTNLLSVKSIEAIVINYRDITERKLAEEKIKQHLERLTALREVDQLIASTYDLHLGLNVLLSRVIGLLNADAADVLLLNPVQQTLEYNTGIGFRTNANQSASVRLGESLAGKLAVERQVTQINIAQDRNNILLGGYLKGEDFVAYSGAPLIVKGKVIGVLELFDRSVVERDHDWLDFFTTLAGQAALMIDNTKLFTDLQLSNTELSLAYDATIEGWSRALDLRDKETEGHTQRVTEQTVELARRVGFSEDKLIQIRRGALLHDIGKLGVPDAVLLKSDDLTETEWGIMKKHPVFAYDMLLPIRYLRGAAIDIPYSHHEKWDGTGYPRALRGEQIPLAARVFAIVDVWDALTSDRPYRPAWAKEKALAFIREQSGKHFDPQVVQEFLKIVETNPA